MRRSGVPERYHHFSLESRGFPVLSSIQARARDDPLIGKPGQEDLETSMSSRLMKVKLRELVTYASEPNGITLRLADNFLHIEGRDVAPLFARLLPYLDGRASIDAIVAAVNPGARPCVQNLLSALMDAGLLYTLADDSDSCWHGSAYRPYLRRIEWNNDRALAAFHRYLESELYIEGEPKLVERLTGAIVNAGLRAPTPLYANRSSAPHVGSVLLLACQESSLSDYESVLSQKFRCIAFYFQMRGSVFVGRFPPGAPCSSILRLPGAIHPARDYFADPRLLDFAACVLVQRYMDLETGIVPRDQQGFLLEITGSLDVRSHPLPIGDHRCTLSSFTNAEGPAAGFEDELLANLPRRFADETTGLVRSIDEGDLTQFPYNQTRAQVRLPSSGDCILAEFGEDIRSARLAAFCSALEEYLHECLDADRGPRSTETLASENNLARRGANAVVCSSLDPDKIDMLCFLRALSALASSDANWASYPLQHVLTVCPEEPAFLYLQDTGALPRIQLYINKRFSTHGCYAMRVCYNEAPIAVVSGVALSEILAAALAEAWMYESELDASQPDLKRRLRLRAALPAEQTSIPKAFLEDQTLEFHMLEVKPPEALNAHPVRFAYSWLTSTVPCGTCDAADAALV